MKKYWSRVLMGVVAILSLFYGAAAVAASPIMLDGIATAERAIVDEEGVWLPAELIGRELYSNVTVNQTNKQVELHFALPRVALGEPTADRLIFSATTLALPYKEINAALYVDAAAAGKLLGFTWEKQDEVKIKRNQYGSFSPLVLRLDETAPSLNGEKINLVWQPTFEAVNNLAKLEKHAGLNVVSPSWFAIIDETGLLKNNADAEYVRQAHAKGYQVWALITNSFDPDLTNRVLHDATARKNVIKQLLIYARLYGLDGINLDFENVYDEDRAALTEFVGEISAALKLLGTTVSMDVTAPSNISQWSSCYDRKGLSDAVDYMILMAYDEHWRTSPVSGSVASIGWVETGVINTLKEVPAEKLILGVPFYMREWQEDLSGNRRVQAKTMTMERAERTIQEQGLTPVWLEQQGQYYFEYQKGGNLYRVWQEEAKSLSLKAGLVEKHQLAGIAAWRKGFEKPEIWNLLQENLQLPNRDAAAEQTKKKQKKS